MMSDATLIRKAIHGKYFGVGLALVILGPTFLYGAYFAIAVKPAFTISECKNINQAFTVDSAIKQLSQCARKAERLVGERRISSQLQVIRSASDELSAEEQLNGNTAKQLDEVGKEIQSNVLLEKLLMRK